MRAQAVGTYRQRVALFDVPEMSRDSYGQPSTSGTQIVAPTGDGMFSAEIRMLKGDEILNIRQQWPTATHQVKMRWLGSSILPSFSGTGNTRIFSPTVSGFSASYQGITLIPVAGLPVAGTNIPPGATILATPAPTATSFTMSVGASATGTAVPISVGPSANNPFGLILERMYLIDALDGSRLNILNANNVEKRNRQWILICEEKKSN